MKKNFLLLSILACVSLSGCDSFTNIFSSKPKDEENSQTNQNDNSSQQSSLITFTQEDDDNTTNTTTDDNTVVPVTGDDAERINAYYQGFSASSSGSSLRTALCTLIKKGHTKNDYDTLEIAMKTTDRNWEKSPDPNDENPYMNLLYLVNNEGKPRLWNESHGSYGSTVAGKYVWDKEHIWAKSNGFNKEGLTAYSDLHHLRASDMANNNNRGNLAFAAFSANSTFTTVKDCNGDNSGKKGSYYEPIDRDKGDVARALFYMATRYMNSGDGSTSSLNLTNGTDSSGGKWGYLNTLLQWHTQDPPDAFEKHRNSLVQDIQGNRNPYIDHPEWAQKVFA